MTRQKRESRLRLVLSDAQLNFLRTGKADDAEVFLAWGHGRDEGEVQRTFTAIRDDYPPGEFPWAERKYGGGKR